MNRRAQILIGIGVIMLFLAAVGYSWWRERSAIRAFDGARAYDDVVTQVDFGARIPGSAAHRQAGEFIQSQLERAGWQAAFQDFDYQGVAVRNVIAKANVGAGPLLILGAHYDSRRLADQDPARSADPVPGANDGASGVAVLLELARVLKKSAIPYEIWLTFFDAEDQGDLGGWDWIAGSRYLAAQMTPAEVARARAMILLDMVGDADQQFYVDANSDPALVKRIWDQAAALGYGPQFQTSSKWAMLDDHIPFRERGIAAVDIIDFDYPAWHTTSDTADRVSPVSLERVGRTLQVFLEAMPGE